MRRIGDKKIGATSITTSKTLERKPAQQTSVDAFTRSKKAQTTEREPVLPERKVVVHEKAHRDALAIEAALGANARRSRWSALRKLTTKRDILRVKGLCQSVNPDDWERVFVAFWDNILKATKARPAALAKRDATLSKDWHQEPFYYLYVQYFGAADGELRANFDRLTKQLDYLEELGVKNLYLLPHYESPMADGGYDVSDYSPRQDLGGEAGFQRFMNAANKRGFRVVTDAPFNHTSIEHPWFQAALENDREKMDYFLRVDGREKIEQFDRNGDIVCRYRDPDGTETELVTIFPDVSTEHSLRQTIAGEEHQFFREFYPFQVDLNLRNPTLLNELFQLLGQELNSGTLGKRTDAIAHWLKQPGTANDGLPETHSLQALFKSFLRHVCPRAIIMPEVVRAAPEAAKYCGEQTTISRKRCASEGDALFAFELQGALREMLYFQTSDPFWKKVFQLPDLPANATWVNLLEHHDETYLGFITDHNHKYLGAYIEDKGGKVYKNGMSAGGRFASCLPGNPERLANAIFCLYLAPGTPAIYYGTEIGWQNDHAHARARQEEQHQTFEGLGLDIPWDKTFDARELQRGPIPAAAFEDATQKHPAAKMLKTLNELREKRASLRSLQLTPIDNGHDGVLSMVRFADGADLPLLALANLTHEEMTVRLPVQQLEEKMPGGETINRFRSLLDDGDAFSLPIEDDHIVMTLPPYSSRLLEHA